MKIFKMFLTLALIFVSVLTVQSIIPHSDFLIYGSLVFTSPAAAGTYFFDLKYIPQFLIYDAAAAPLTNLRVQEQSDGVLLDLPLAGIAQVRAFKRFGLVASTVTMFRLANGHIPNKNVTVTLVQPGAVAIPFYTSSDRAGSIAFKYTTAALLAGQPTVFKDFSGLFLPGLAAADTVLIKFRSGFSQLFNGAELLELTARYQNSQLATGFIVNNVDAYMHEVEVTQAIAGAAYLMSFNVKL
jgi:hypothetical protein